MTTHLAPVDPASSTTIRFFLSSTFADFQTERTVLQQRVFPELRQLCAQAGFRLQPIDLRWGVSEEASTERQTLHICFDELERCRRLSPDFFLLILLGERYGSCLLPPVVSKMLVAHMLPHLSPKERGTFEAAYRLDENAIPPEYALLRAEGAPQGEDEALRQLLVRAAQAAGVSEADRLLFAGSATHREIQLGLLGVPLEAGQERGVLCAVRRFDGSPHGPEAQRFLESDEERAAKVRWLVNSVVRQLPRKQVLHYKVAWPDAQGPRFDEEALAAHYLQLLQPRIETVISSRTAARSKAVAHRRDAVALANVAFENERATWVVGRDAELSRLAAYLADEVGAGLPLVVIGVAGSGKSTLLAEAAKRARVAHPGAVLLVRYLGITPSTESLFRLLDDLRRAIATAYGQELPRPIVDLFELINAVSTQLETLQVPAERPLLLLLDALEQLGPTPQQLAWLPRVLPPQVRLIVSVLPDRPELAQLRERVPAEQILSLGPLTREAGRAILHHLLDFAGGAAPVQHPQRATPGRRLTAAQEAVILNGFAKGGLPLYVQVAAGEARSFRSFDPVSPLPDSVPALLNLLLARWEDPGRHGPVFVAHALGDLAAARNGLAEDELLDLLARDEEVRAELHHLSPNSPPIDPALPLPAALWARLSAEAVHLLTEREADGVRLFTYYHRQLLEAVQARYKTAQAGRRHRALARYFKDQPLQSTSKGKQLANLRKLSEQPYQETSGALQSELEATLCDLRFLGAKCAAGLVYDLLNDFDRSKHMQTHQVMRVQQSVLQSLGALISRPEWSLQTLYNHLSWILPSESCKDAREELNGYRYWVRAAAPLPDDISNVTMNVVFGFASSMQSLASDRRAIAIASPDGEIEFHNLDTGTLLEKRRLGTNLITAIALSDKDTSGVRHLAWMERDGRVFSDRPYPPIKCLPAGKLLYHHTGGIMTVSEEGALVVWRPWQPWPSTGEPILILQEQLARSLLILRFGPQGEQESPDQDRIHVVYAAGRANPTIGIATWDGHDWTIRSKVLAHSLGIIDADCDRQGNYLALLQKDRSIEILDMQGAATTPDPRTSYVRDSAYTITGAPVHCAYHPQKDEVIFGTAEGHIAAWDWKNKKLTKYRDYCTPTQSRSLVQLGVLPQNGQVFYSFPEAAQTMAPDKPFSERRQHPTAVRDCFITAAGDQVISTAEQDSTVWWATFEGLQIQTFRSLSLTLSRSAITMIAPYHDTDAILVGNTQGLFWRQPPDRAVEDPKETWQLFDSPVLGGFSPEPGIVIVAYKTGRILRVNLENDEVDILHFLLEWDEQIALRPAGNNGRFWSLRRTGLDTRTSVLSLFDEAGHEQVICQRPGHVNLTVSADGGTVCLYGRNVSIWRQRRRKWALVQQWSGKGIRRAAFLGGSDHVLAVIPEEGSWLEIRDIDNYWQEIAAVWLPDQATCLSSTGKRLVVGFLSGSLLSWEFMINNDSPAHPPQ